MSPTVPPISVITTSGRLPSASGSAIARMRRLISSVMCGMTCTVSPRYSPRRSLAITVEYTCPVVTFADPGQVAVEEPLVVADVEVGLGAVLGDEHLTVLERVHGARVDVEVGIELLHRHLQAACGEQLAEAAGGEALAEGGRHATADEEMLGRGLRVPA